MTKIESSDFYDLSHLRKSIDILKKQGLSELDLAITMSDKETSAYKKVGELYGIEIYSHPNMPKNTLVIVSKKLEDI